MQIKQHAVSSDQAAATLNSTASAPAALSTVLKFTDPTLQKALQRLLPVVNCVLTQDDSSTAKPESIERDEALALFAAPLNELCAAANLVRTAFKGDDFALCAIAAVKSGRCSENCSYCAQSARQQNEVLTHEMDLQEFMACAERAVKNGAKRFSAVASGKAVKGQRLERFCHMLFAVKERFPELLVCASVGLIGLKECQALKAAGVTRLHCNLESSKAFFPSLCQSHSFEDKVKTLKAAQEAGLEVCSGGIFGVGESRSDRVDLALALRALGVKSVPLNLFVPIAGTPMENAVSLTEEEFLRTIAVFRLLLPDAYLRLAGGRLQLKDYGKKAMQSGINAMIGGSMLTTAGPSPEDDLKTLKALRFKLVS